MAKIVETNIESRAIGTSYSLWQIALVGVALGLLFWCLTSLIERYIINPMFCRSITNALACLDSTIISGNIATILVAAVGTTLILRLYLARPLIIAVAAGASLWGLAQWTNGLSWMEAIAWSMLLYGLAYTLFSWVARWLQVIPVIVTMILIILAVRFSITL
jgi:hypothetical protein